MSDIEEREKLVQLAMKKIFVMDNQSIKNFINGADFFSECFRKPNITVKIEDQKKDYYPNIFFSVHYKHTEGQFLFHSISEKFFSIFDLNLEEYFISKTLVAYDLNGDYKQEKIISDITKFNIYQTVSLYDIWFIINKHLLGYKILKVKNTFLLKDKEENLHFIGLNLMDDKFILSYSPSDPLLRSNKGDRFFLG